MPAKMNYRAQKRRGAEVDESTSGRVTKKKGKNKREVTYDTYEEAFDGGVQQEEQGERYRDGEKAQRFYEKAVQLYQTAYEFKKTYDAAYNQVRVLYTLSTSFLLPPTCIAHLQTSINLYKEAIELTNSPLLRMDAAFNLAQALEDLADILEDTQGDNTIEEIRRLRVEAIDMLGQVLDGQEAFLRSTAESEEVDAVSQAVDEEMEVDVGVEAGNDAAISDTTPDVEDEAASQGDGASFETYLPTPSTFIDTVLRLIELHLSLWTSTSPLRLTTEDEQISVRSILDRAGNVAPSGRQAELDLAEIKVLITTDQIMWDLLKSQVRIGTGHENTLDGAVVALSQLASSLSSHPPDEQSVHMDIHTTLADTHISAANRMLVLVPQLPLGPSPVVQKAYAHLTDAITSLTNVIQSPIDGFTPKGAHPSALLSMSKVSLGRARLGTVNETARRNQAQLMENARSYVTRALDGLGWGHVASQDLESKTPWQAGWEIELLSRNCMLQMLRITFFASLLGHGLGGDSKEILNRIKKFAGGERKVGSADVERFWMEVEEDGGFGEGEKEWWVGIVGELG